MTPAPAHLVVRHLAFGYPGLPLFDDWSHDFAPGLTWVRGANGCGKSTLLRLIGGALVPDGGTIEAGGADARDAPIDFRRDVYWCGPDDIVFDHLKPLEFFGFIAGLYPRFDPDVAATWVSTFGLEPFLPRRIRELSTGTRRKVAVIAAMAADTSVIVLDEPLAGLDQSSLTMMRKRFAVASAERERVWIVASHEPLDDAAVPVRILDLPAR